MRAQEVWRSGCTCTVPEVVPLDSGGAGGGVGVQHGDIDSLQSSVKIATAARSNHGYLHEAVLWCMAVLYHDHLH
jgi:hypothetical protein